MGTLTCLGSIKADGLVKVPRGNVPNTDIALHSLVSEAASESSVLEGQMCILVIKKMFIVENNSFKCTWKYERKMWTQQYLN